MTIAAELKRLIAKKGGTPPTSNKIEDCLECLCNCKDALSWNYLKDRPFGEEVVEESIVGLEFAGIPAATIVHQHNLNIPFQVGQIWNVVADVGSPWEGQEVKQADDGTIYIGDYPNICSVPFYVTANEIKCNWNWVNMYRLTDVNIVCVSGTVTETKVKTIDPKYIKDMYYEIPNRYAEVKLVEDNWSGKATCKLEYAPVEWSAENSYKIRVDGATYDFDGMASKNGGSLTGNTTVYYIGAEWYGLNSNMDFSVFPFCFVTDDFTNIYVVFEDGTLNHTVEFFMRGDIKRIDPKYIGYDAVIKTHVVENGEGNPPAATLLEGSYDAIVEKLKNDELVRVKAISTYDYIEDGVFVATEKVIREAFALCGVDNLTNEERVFINTTDGAYELLPDGTLIPN